MDMMINRAMIVRGNQKNNKQIYTLSNLLAKNKQKNPATQHHFCGISLTLRIFFSAAAHSHVPAFANCAVQVQALGQW